MPVEDELEPSADESSSSGDLKQIGTSPVAKDVMNLGEMDDHFISKGDMYKFAVCIAIREGKEPISDARFTTSHSTTELDPDGALAFLVSSYRKTDQPYRLSQKLAEAGFRFIRERLEAGDALDDLLA